MSSPGIKINEIDLTGNDFYKKNHNKGFNINIYITTSLDDLIPCCDPINKMQYIDESDIDNDYYE